MTQTQKPEMKHVDEHVAAAVDGDVVNVAFAKECLSFGPFLDASPGWRRGCEARLSFSRPLKIQVILALGTWWWAYRPNQQVERDDRQS